MEETIIVSETEEPAAQSLPEEIPQSRPKRKLYGEHYLAILAGILAVITLALTLFSLPYILAEPQEEDPEQIIHQDPPTATPTIPEVDPDTGEKLPEPEKNPYGKLDFQYDGRYLGCIKAGTIPGIDVSYYQGKIDWKKVKQSGIEFAIIRVGYRGYGEEGKMVEDKLFHKNIQGALDAGLRVGVYFFSQATSVEEALEEADFVLARIRQYELTLPVVFDWEYVSEEARTANVDPRTLTDCYLAFCGKMEEEGYTPMPYFNSYQSRKMMYLTELEQYPFWLALYSDRMTYPYRIEMWQYTDSGKVPGIEGSVDINLMFTDEYF